MPQDTINLIISLVVYAIIGAVGLISILGIYIVTKYGRTPIITVFASLAFAGIFCLMAISIFVSLARLPN